MTVDEAVESTLSRILENIPKTTIEQRDHIRDCVRPAFNSLLVAGERHRAIKKRVAEELPVNEVDDGIYTREQPHSFDMGFAKGWRAARDKINKIIE